MSEMTTDLVVAEGLRDDPSITISVL